MIQVEPYRIADRSRQAGVPAIIIPIIPGGMAWGWLITGTRLWEANPIDAAQSLAAQHQAIYMIHGDADEVVPYHEGQELYAAYRAAGVNVTFWSLPGLPHVAGFSALHDEYLQRLDTFFRRELAV